jgi:dienelactone hydrolase
MHQREIVLSTDGVELPGTLTVPDDARGVVAFAHGSGSSRHSSRNRYVAAVLHEAGLGTLLFDLLTDREAADRRLVFDIDLLARRLAVAGRWLRQSEDVRDLPLGYFGASTGAAAALTAAHAADPAVAAVVSRGGRPDLATVSLNEAPAPTLLIVGGDDVDVLELNRRVAERMSGSSTGWPVALEVVPGATHLFEEPGMLETAASLARDWFVRFLRRG